MKGIEDIIEGDSGSFSRYDGKCDMKTCIGIDI